MVATVELEPAVPAEAPSLVRVPELPPSDLRDTRGHFALLLSARVSPTHVLSQSS